MQERAIGRLSARSICTAVALVGLAAFSACGQSQPVEELGEAQLAVSTTNAGVLGCEDVTDWTGGGTTLSSSTTHSQGLRSLRIVAPQGWREITNTRRLTSLGTVGTNFTYDLRPDAAVPWGETRAIVILPSQGEFWRDLGSRQLSTLTAGQFNSVSFPIPADLRTKILASYTDLQVKIVVSGPAANYRLDNLSFGQGAGGGGTNFEFSIKVPDAVTPDGVLFASTQELRLNDRVKTYPAKGLDGSIANLGLGETNLGVDSVIGDVRSTGPTFVRNRSIVDGLIASNAPVDFQAGATLVGEMVPLTANSRTLTWTVNFPSGSLPSVSVEPGQSASRAPGNYDSASVKTGATLTLSPGRYTFRSVALEPSSTLVINNATGPTYIHIQNSLIHRGTVRETAATPGAYAIGVASTETVHIETPFSGGALVVPRGKIELKSVGESHRGSFFASLIEVHQGGTVVHIPSSALPGLWTRALTARACGTSACANGQVPVSRTACATPIAQGGTCNPAVPSQSVCAQGLTCQDGECSPGGLPIGGTCNSRSNILQPFPNPDLPCPYDFEAQEPTSCREIVLAGDPIRIVPWSRSCQRFQKLGEVCVSTLTCEPGLSCVGPITRQTCQVPCTAASQCPCSGDGTTPEVSCVSGGCAYCHDGLNDLCSTASGDGCCGNLVCEGIFSGTAEPGEVSGLHGSQRCKRQVDAACQNDSDCVYSVNTPAGGGPPNQCVGGTCQPVPRELGESCAVSNSDNWVGQRGLLFSAVRSDYCAQGLICAGRTGTCLGGEDTPCANDSQCASPLRCLGGSCSPPPCVPGVPCTASDTGECRRGTTSCNGNTTVCDAASPTAEVCDGRDNDCDGRTDEEAEVPTQGDECIATDYSCGGGQPSFEVPGTLDCERGEMRCVINRCDTNDPMAENCLCTNCGAGNNTGKPCGWCAATPCGASGPACAPNSRCLGPPSSFVCTVDTACNPPQLGCWEPEHVDAADYCFNGVQTGGPSDGDGDGIIDFQDECPTDAGIQTVNPLTNGCPDGDDDGIVDTEDECPEQEGDGFNGCPIDN